MNVSPQDRLSEDDQEDVMSAALAAVASTRRSRSPDSVGPKSSSAKRGLARQPLPREFRESYAEDDERDVKVWSGHSSVECD